MKKVLIIGNFWPYRKGSRRITSLAKCLKEFGWSPVILTGSISQKPDFKVRYIEVDYKEACFIGPKIDFNKKEDSKIKRIHLFLKAVLRYIKKKILKYASEIVTYPDKNKYFKYPAFREAKLLFKKEKIDAIISIYPISSHFIAKKLKVKYNVPWIADFPDLWSQNCNYSHGTLRKLADKRMEIKTLFFADALITVSKPLAEKLSKLHKKKEIYAIPSGFDIKTFNSNSSKLTNEFTITYTGTFYKEKRTPLKLFLALRDLIDKKVINPYNVKVRFFGPKTEWIEEMIIENGLSDIVRQYGTVDIETSVQKQKESQVLLLLKWEDPKEKGICAGKIFEYFASKRPILTTGGSKDVISDLLEETKAGIDALDIEEIKEALKLHYFEYLKNGKVSYNGNLKKIEKYNELEMVKKFANILNKF
ncbi:MAG: glycosyltransferase [Candidatus Pacebacteria bacterium]|nr:glycosyltransferase [Candidatus Paceibacterota bacterium]